MDLRPLDARQAENWRKRYREQLGLPVIPDYHEALCRLGRAYSVEESGRKAGYLIFAQEALRPAWAPVIPEIFLDPTAARYAKASLRAIFAKLQPRTVIGRTDDPVGFPLLMDLRMPNQISSPLYTLDEAPAWSEDPELHILASTLDDVHRLLPLYASVSPEDGGISEDIVLAKSLAAWRHYRVTAGNRVVAVTYVAPQGQRFVSVATIVAADARRRGVGRYLTAYAVRREIAEGKVFVAAMNAENEAAQGLVESLGARLAAHFINFAPADLAESA
jgi:ribosomal protein S18 acetylase RimI-like enzyme